MLFFSGVKGSSSSSGSGSSSRVLFSIYVISCADNHLFTTALNKGSSKPTHHYKWIARDQGLFPITKFDFQNLIFNTKSSDFSIPNILATSKTIYFQVGLSKKKDMEKSKKVSNFAHPRPWTWPLSNTVKYTPKVLLVSAFYI